jgi:hypothetical protein
MKRHGHTRHTWKSLTYVSWIEMRRRCTNPKRENYRHYGGRGITVCERWMTSFEAFLTDMGKRPSRRHSLEREDVDGNYEPENCVWATQRQQIANRRVMKEAA